MVHELRIIPMYFADVLAKRKMFELRKNDRDFQVGDKLILREYDGDYTGNVCERWVQYVFRGTGLYGLQPGYCILGVSDYPAEKERFLSWLSKFCRHIDMGDKPYTDAQAHEFWKQKLYQIFGWKVDE